MCLLVKLFRVLKCVRAFQIGILKSWFWGKRKTGEPGVKPLGARERASDKLNPNMASVPGFNPGPHWGGGGRVLSPLPPCLLQIFFDSDIKTRGNSLNVTDACAKSRQLLWPEQAQRTSNLHVGPRPYAEVPLRYYNYWATCIDICLARP